MTQQLDWLTASIAVALLRLALAAMAASINMPTVSCKKPIKINTSLYMIVVLIGSFHIPHSSPFSNISQKAYGCVSSSWMLSTPDRKKWMGPCSSLGYRVKSTCFVLWITCKSATYVKNPVCCLRYDKEGQECRTIAPREGVPRYNTVWINTTHRYLLQANSGMLSYCIDYQACWTIGPHKLPVHHSCEGSSVAITDRCTRQLAR